jgi:NitT/TauT family transport system substrate-binding protein
MSLGRIARGPSHRMLLLLALVVAFALAGCAPADDAAEPEPEAEPEQPETDEPDTDEPDTDDATPTPTPDDEPAELEPVGELTVGSIGSPPLVAMIQPYVALEEGFYEKYGVDVTLRDMETGLDAARAVEAGDLDMAYSPTGPVLTLYGAGVPVTAVSGWPVLDWFIGSGNPEVQECEDLAGEAIAGDSVGGARYSVMQIILDSCGLTVDDVEFVALPGRSALEGVAAGAVDTAVLHIEDQYRIEELAPDRPLQVVAWLEDVDPMQHYLMVWGQPDTIEEKREEIVRFLAATIESLRWMHDEANYDRLIEIGTVTGDSPEVLRASFPDFFELNWYPLDTDGLPQDKIEATIAEQIRLENIPEGQEPTYDDIVDLSLYEEALELVEQYGDY